MPQVKDALGAVDGAAVARALRRRTATYRLDVDGATVELGPDDVEVRAESPRGARARRGRRVRGRARHDRSTTSSAPRASPASSSARSTTSARRSDLEIADRIRVAVYARRAPSPTRRAGTATGSPARCSRSSGRSRRSPRHRARSTRSRSTANVGVAASTRCRARCRSRRAEARGCRPPEHGVVARDDDQEDGASGVA